MPLCVPFDPLKYARQKRQELEEYRSTSVPVEETDIIRLLKQRKEKGGRSESFEPRLEPEETVRQTKPPASIMSSMSSTQPTLASVLQQQVTRANPAGRLTGENPSPIIDHQRKSQRAPPAKKGIIQLVRIQFHSNSSKKYAQVSSVWRDFITGGIQFQTS